MKNRKNIFFGQRWTTTLSGNPKTDPTLKVNPHKLYCYIVYLEGLMYSSKKYGFLIYYGMHVTMSNLGCQFI